MVFWAVVYRTYRLPIQTVAANQGRFIKPFLPMLCPNFFQTCIPDLFDTLALKIPGYTFSIEIHRADNHIPVPMDGTGSYEPGARNPILIDLKIFGLNLPGPGQLLPDLNVGPLGEPEGLK